MESFITRFKNVLVLVAILLAQTIRLAVQVRRPVEAGAPDGATVTLLRYWSVSTVTPFERFFHRMRLSHRAFEVFKTQRQCSTNVFVVVDQQHVEDNFRFHGR